MTTAFAHAAHTQFWASFRTQPMGCLLCLGAAAAFWGCLHVALTGSHLGRLSARMLTPRWLWVMAALLLVAWAYKYAVWPKGG